MSENFSAKESLLGYLYQCEYALLESVKRLDPFDSFWVYLEIFDDITFENDKNAIELLQTKHHVNTTKNLTESSVDLWKTIRIWVEKFNSYDESTIFFLITTQSPQSNSLIEYLGINKRNIELAIASLNSIAITSQNETNRSAYKVFNDLSENDKYKLFEKAYIICNEVSIDNIDKELKKIFVKTARVKYLDSYITRLKGYWYRRLIKSLSSEKFLKVSSEELLAEIDYLREEISEANLPIDEDILSAVIDEAGYLNHVFVHQLNIIETSRNRIFRAIKDYFRASEQRSRWIREELIYIGELDRYEVRLIEAWQRHFDILAEKISDKALEEEKIKLGKEIFEWIETNIIPIRKCDEPFISIGTFHILADQLKVGWHPEYFIKLPTVLNNLEN